MFLELLLQFVLELFRALLVDELSGHVRRGMTRWVAKRNGCGLRGAVLGVHRRNRDRLLHRLLTEITDDL